MEIVRTSQFFIQGIMIFQVCLSTHYFQPSRGCENNLSIFEWGKSFVRYLFLKIARRLFNSEVLRQYFHPSRNCRPNIKRKFNSYLVSKQLSNVCSFILQRLQMTHIEKNPTEARRVTWMPLSTTSPSNPMRKKVFI